MSQKRNLGIDFIKCLAIFLVCFYHFNWLFSSQMIADFGTKDYLKQVILIICSIGVPLFFMVNGYLILNKPFNFKKTMNGLLVVLGQYYVYLALTMCVYIYLKGLSFIDYFNVKSTIQLFFFSRPEGFPLNYLWFIPCYIAVQLIAPGFKRFFVTWDKNAKQYIYTIIVLGIVAVFFVKDVYALTVILDIKDFSISTIDAAYPFSVRVGTFMVYFLIGGILAKLQNTLIVKNVWLVLGFAIAVVWNWTYWYFISHNTTNSYDIVFESYNMLPTLLLTTVVFLFVMQNVSNVKLGKHITNGIVFISVNTLNIYFIHRLVDIVLFHPIMVTFGLQGVTFLNTIKTITMLILCSLIILVLRQFKFTKWLLR